MNPHRFLLLSALIVGAPSFVACSAQDADTSSSTSEQLKKKKKAPTTCSFDDPIPGGDVPVSNDGSGVVPGSPSYAVGETFPSPDGCNTCACTESGIVCTEIACAGGGGGDPGGGYTGEPEEPPPGPGPGDGVVCSQDAKQCPDGSYVARTGPDCEFAPCE